MIEVRATGLREARAAGELLAASGTTDAVDALIAMVAAPGDQLLTSDLADLSTLVTHRAVPVTVVSL
jgi:DNA-binding transcriptional MocR family regulator